MPETTVATADELEATPFIQVAVGEFVRPVVT
jgi:hypothetical protein